MSAEVSKRRRFLLAFAICAILGGLGGLMMAELQSESEARPRFIPPREEAQDFRLHDQDGDPMGLWDVRGDVVVMTFIYTTCWDLCPAEAATMMKAVKQVGDGVTAFAISVDPVGDTRKRVDDWLRVRNWQNGPMKYLTGTREELAPVWRAYGIVPINATDEDAYEAAESTDRFRAQAADEGLDLAARPYTHPERPAPPPAALEESPDVRDFTYRGRTRHAAGLEYEHSAYVLLIDKRGVQRLGIPFERLDADALAQDLRVLRDEPVK